MNDTNVSTIQGGDSQQVLATLAEGLSDLTPQTRKAAAYVLENPNDVGVSSIREIARAAAVKPNTFVRMARSFGFEGYEDFRATFREEIRKGGANFPDRARWLQDASRKGRHGKLFANMAASAIRNVEQTFASTDAETVKAAADAIVAARHTYVLGVGINHTLARNFAYLADMANNDFVNPERPADFSEAQHVVLATHPLLLLCELQHGVDIVAGDDRRAGNAAYLG